MTLEEALKGIRHHREQIHVRNLWTDPVSLSDEGLKLATYNAYLADDLGGLHKAATDKHHSVYLEVLAKGEGVTKAEQMGKGESTQERYEYERIMFVYRATHLKDSYWNFRLINDKESTKPPRNEPIPWIKNDGTCAVCGEPGFPYCPGHDAP